MKNEDYVETAKNEAEWMFRDHDLVLADVSHGRWRLAQVDAKGAVRPEVAIEIISLWGSRLLVSVEDDDFVFRGFVHSPLTEGIADQNLAKISWVGRTMNIGSYVASKGVFNDESVRTRGIWIAQKAMDELEDAIQDSDYASADTQVIKEASEGLVFAGKTREEMRDKLSELSDHGEALGGADGIGVIEIPAAVVAWAACVRLCSLVF